MDFNTGSPGGGPPPPPPPNRPSASPSGGAAGEFNLSDPVQSFISTVRGVVLNPVGFFRGMRKSGDFVNPLVFAVICAFIGGTLSGIFQLIFPPSLPPALQNLQGDLPPEAQQQFEDAQAAAAPGIGDLLFSMFLTPVFVALGLFIGAGILYLLIMLIIGQSNSGYEATFRLAAYASITQLISWVAPIPYVGGLISFLAGLYAFFLIAIGVREVHATTTGKAAIVALIPATILLIILIIVIVIRVATSPFL